MRTEMRSRERMLAAIRRQPVDHIPLGQIFHSTVLGTPPERSWRNQFERAQVMQYLGLDPVIDIWLPVPEPPPGVTVRKWKEADPDGPDPLLCAEYDTPAGRLVQKVRQTRDWFDRTHYAFTPAWDGNAHRAPDRFDEIDMMDDWFTRRYKVPLVNGPEDLDKLAYLLSPPAGVRRDIWLRDARRAGKMAGEMGLLTQARRVSVGDWFMWLCLIEDFACAMVESPEYVAGFYDLVQRYDRQILDMVLEVQPDVIQYRGWYDTPDYWGPKRLREILAPRIQELAAQTHAGGSLFCYLLPEGYTVYRDILAGLDVDVFLGLEPLAARKSENLAAVKAALGDRHSIWGGVNAPVTVGMGTDEEIDAAVRTAIKTLGPTGFILNACMYIYDDDVSWDRFRVFVEAWKRNAELAG
jgi:hypothetical protein